MTEIAEIINNIFFAPTFNTMSVIFMCSWSFVAGIFVLRKIGEKKQ